MADKLFTPEVVADLEELERRRELSPGMSSVLRDARDAGLIKSRRNKELLDFERKMLAITKADVTEEEARSWANTYRKLRDGKHNDWSGRAHFGKKGMSGYEYHEAIQKEARGNDMSEAFDDKLHKFDTADEAGKIAQAQQYLKKNSDRVSVKAPSTMRRAAVRSAVEGIQLESGETLDLPPDVRTEEEQLSSMNPNQMSDEQKARLIRLGRNEAFKQSYVPMRQFLESKLGRNEFANKIAKSAVITGEIDAEQYDMLPDEDKAVVNSYIRHTRPFDVEEGMIGTLDEAARKGLWASWHVAHAGLRDFSADLNVAFRTAWWAQVDPVAAIDYMDAWERERKNLALMGEAFDIKAPERTRGGKAVVGLVETTPHMAALIFGGPAGMVMAGGAAANHAKRNFMKMKPNAKPEEANVVAGIAGVTAVFVEKMGGFAGSTKFGKYMSKPLLARATADTMTGFVAKNIPRWTEQGIRTFSAEFMEEFGEAYINNVADQVFTEFKPENFTKIEFKDALRSATLDAMEAGDVVFLMSLFGGGKAVASEMSANAGEQRYSRSALDMIDERVAEWIKNNPSEVIDGIENVNDAVLDVWTSNSESKAREILRELGLSNADITAAKPELDAIADAHVERRKKEAKQYKLLESIEKRYDTYKKAMQVDERGATYETVEQLTGSLDHANVGQFDATKNAIEVVEGIKDEGRVFNHEVYTGL